MASVQDPQKNRRRAAAGLLFLGVLTLTAALSAACGPPATQRADPPVVAPVKPDQETIVEKRNRPEVIYATKLVTPFSAMRYTLSREGSPEAKALADEVATTMGDLRIIRLDPDEMTWEEMKSKTDATVAKVEASKFAKDQSITKAIERYRQFIAEYDQAKSAQPVPGTSEE